MARVPEEGPSIASKDNRPLVETAYDEGGVGERSRPRAARGIDAACRACSGAKCADHTNHKEEIRMNAFATGVILAALPFAALAAEDAKLSCGKDVLYSQEFLQQ